MKMQYASVNGERQEAQPGLSGKCLCCDSPTIARCGPVRIWHWAHRGKCDPWWEGETEWHREWKNQFPKECQEVIHITENNEKHIADVKTDQGYVIEFQFSPIEPEERQSREDFYKKMVWVVNSTKRLRDKGKFIGIWESSNRIDNKVDVRILCAYFDECALLRDWGSCKVPVFIDFGEDTLWGLLPKTYAKSQYAFKIGRNELIAYLRPAPQMSFEALLNQFSKFINAKEMLFATQQAMQHSKANRPVARRRRHM